MSGIVVALLTVGVAALLGTGAATSDVHGVATPYSVTFSESGLPSGTTWSVHVAYLGCGCHGVYKTVRSNLSTLTVPVTKGPYQYTVLLVSGYYVLGPAHGTFNVSVSNVSGIPVRFQPVVPFATEFLESGLPNGTLWTVSVSGNGSGQLRLYQDRTETSYGPNLTFSLPNGSYHYTVAPVPGSFFFNHSAQGTFTISGASPAPIQVRFATPPTFPLTFTEHGLPNATNWSVRVWGWGGVPISETLSSTSDAITFSLPNGTFRYAVADVLGFGTPSPAGGRLILTNTSLNVAVTFRAVAPGQFYPVAFEESGLANGTHWSVTVTMMHTFGHSHQETQSANGTVVFFLLPNGTYRFQVHVVRMYTLLAGAEGSFNVSGSSPSVFLVTFKPIPTYTVTFSESGLVNGTQWAVLVRSQPGQPTPWPIHVVGESDTTTVTFAEPNGSYCYRIYPVLGYSILPGEMTGTITIAGGAPPAISITFTVQV